MTTESATVRDPAAIAAHRRRGIIFLALAVGAVGFAITAQLAMSSNYYNDVVKLSATQIGRLEGFREFCGVTALLVLAILAGLAEPIVGFVMLLLLSAGLAGLCYAPSYLHVIIWSVVWSQGLHVWMPLPHSMGLALSEPGREGRMLGLIHAAGAVGAAAGLGTVLVLRLTGMSIRHLWLVTAVAALVAAAACLGIPRQIKTPGPRFVFRWKYRLYYVLSLLEGWRKQIFTAFAGLLLVKIYHVELKTIVTLWIIIQVIGWISSPLVGRLIDRVGERPVMIFYFSCLVGCFIGYAVATNLYVLYALFIIDCSLLVFTLALTTFVNRIAPPSDHTGTLSMGVAMNHVAAVIMPLIGGLLWDRFGHRWPFLLGALAAVISVGVATRVPPRVKPGDSRHEMRSPM